MFFRDILKIETKKGISFKDITTIVNKLVEECKIQEGLCNLYLTSTTAGLLINENERMLMEDFRIMFEDLVNKEINLHPSNAHAHLRSGLLDVTKTIPISNGKLILGDGQKIILWEFDTKDREREIIVTVNGE